MGSYNMRFKGNITKIPNYAFQENRTLTSIIIPDTVESIEFASFCGCVGLTDVTIGNNVETIGEGAFNNCTSLTSITIPDSVTLIDKHCFCGCVGLTDVTIGNNVETIGKRCFTWCNNLSEIDIPSNVKIIDDYCFEDNYIDNISLSEGLETIGGGCFLRCNNLTNIIIPSTITTIKGSGFIGYCDNIEYIELKSVFPPTVELKRQPINDEIFPDTNLCPIFVPDNSVQVYKTAWPGDAWRICPTSNRQIGATTQTNAPLIEIAKNMGWISPTQDKWYQAMMANITDDMFGSSLFENNTNLTTFDEFQYFTSLTTIGERTFRNASNLYSIILPDSITTIGVRALQGCSSLTSITIPNSVTTIGDYAFYNCNHIDSITIPNSVTTIGGTVFKGCNITSITIPNSVTTISNKAFYDISTLTSVTINSTCDIPESCFESCENLSVVSIVEGVERIERYAFRGCDSLTSITLPSSINYLNYGIFDGYGGNYSQNNPYLLSVYCLGLVPAELHVLGTNTAFSLCTDLTIYVDSSVVDVYKNTWQTESSKIISR